MRRQKIIQNWILIGLIMSLIQISLGGITRLTDSGLSITEWKVVLGSIPPTNQDQWEETFNKYKEIGQFQKVNTEMTLGEFKRIYFWEWLHRNWARLIGLVFIFPFVLFFIKKWLQPKLTRQLLIAMGLGAAQAGVGWIMVKSGLNTESTYVSPYKLSLHFFFALALVLWLWWIYLEQGKKPQRFENILKWRSSVNLLSIVLILQLLLGCFVAGMRGARTFNTWPTMDGGLWPKFLNSKASWEGPIWTAYEQINTLPVFFQFSHRMLAYIFVLALVWFVIRCFRSGMLNLYERNWSLVFLGTTLLQLVLGIGTLLMTKASAGKIPIDLGVAHQFVAIGIAMIVTFYYYQSFLGRRKAL